MPAALLLLAAAAASLLAAPPSARAAAAEECRAPLGVPCFTVTYEHSLWALVQYPVRDFISTQINGTMAVRGDGAVTHRKELASRFAARDQRDTKQLSDSLYNALFYLGNQVHRRATGGADAECRSVLPAAFGADLQIERTGTARLAGEPVVNFKLKNASRELSISIAPALDCQVLRLESVDYRYRYLPVRKELFEAKQVRRGEPAAQLFQAAAKQ
ncbi:MAG: hypothetical protein IT162_10980 [Bryobacterales bacterium]|nr:hypothetical protein [Bryobacterales bacterium]